jgi:importin subunit alpha-6/7
MSDASRYIPEHRRAQHKGRNQFRGDELRRRREDQQVEIRKQKKEENLAKRRNLDLKVQGFDGAPGEVSDSDDENSLLNRKVSQVMSSRVAIPLYFMNALTNNR